MIKTSALGIFSQGNPLGEVVEDFVIRNPRKLLTDQEYVMVFQNPVTSAAAVHVSFWCRTAVALP